jgi:hypothetical protein
MVRLSDIIRDLSEKKSQDKPALQQETIELKEDKETIGQMRHNRPFENLRGNR